MMSEEQYEVALSFAGEDRVFAKELADALQQRGIKVFYDEYEKAKLWGQDLYTHLSKIYQNGASYVVMFISRHYAANVWTSHERKSAQARALKESREYILPIRLDRTEIEGVSQTIGYLSWPPENAESIADIIRIKLHKTLSHTKKSTSSIGTSGELYLRIIKIISDVLGVDEEEVTPTAHIIDDFNADSLKAIDIIARLETEFDVEISEGEAEMCVCAVDIYKCLREKVKMDKQGTRHRGQFPFR